MNQGMLPLKVLISDSPVGSDTVFVQVWQGKYERENKPEDYQLVESFHNRKNTPIDLSKWFYTLSEWIQRESIGVEHF